MTSDSGGAVNTESHYINMMKWRRYKVEFFFFFFPGMNI